MDLVCQANTMGIKSKKCLGFRVKGHVCRQLQHNAMGLCSAGT